MRIQVYDDSQKRLWDEFVRNSKNGTFLFLRDYMDYHGDRFLDNSLLIWDDKEHLIALVPANKKGELLITHEGLTYGGVVTDEEMKAPLMLDVLGETLGWARQHGFVKLIYKAVPHIYHRIPADEDRYALFRYGATLYRCDVTTVVVPAEKISFQGRRIRSIKKALAAGVSWGLSDKYEEFWSIVEDNLWSVYRQKPVHTLAELRRLQASFPENIKLFCVVLDGETLAGTVIYESHNVAHAQYIASSKDGRSWGALDMLFSHLIGDVYQDKKYFDFGISTEADGRYLNTGLVSFKEGFGGRTVTHDFYEVRVAQ